MCIRNHTLNFLKSYITNRRQGVKTNNCVSDYIIALCGVPQETFVYATH